MLAVLSVLAALGFAKSRPATVPLDELIVTSMCVGVGVAFVASVINKVARLGLLSRMADLQRQLGFDLERCGDVVERAAGD